MTAFKLAAAWAAIGLGCLATPAHADWRFTRWGMTVDEVVAASNGKVGPRDPKDLAAERAEGERLAAQGAAPYREACTHRLLEPLTVADIAFHDVQFCFSPDGRLISVVQYSQTSALIVAAALAEAIGPAVEVDDNEFFPFWRFVDRERGNTMTVASRGPRDLAHSGSTLGYSRTASGF